MHKSKFSKLGMRALFIVLLGACNLPYYAIIIMCIGGVISLKIPLKSAPYLITTSAYCILMAHWYTRYVATNKKYATHEFKKRNIIFCDSLGFFLCMFALSGYTALANSISLTCLWAVLRVSILSALIYVNARINRPAVAETGQIPYWGSQVTGWSFEGSDPQNRTFPKPEPSIPLAHRPILFRAPIDFRVENHPQHSIPPPEIPHWHSHASIFTTPAAFASPFFDIKSPTLTT